MLIRKLFSGPLVAKTFCAMLTTTIMLRKWGRYVTVCTVRLKALLRTSFSRTASRMEDTVPNTRLITLMASVFRILSRKSVFVSGSLKR